MGKRSAPTAAGAAVIFTGPKEGLVGPFNSLIPGEESGIGHIDRELREGGEDRGIGEDRQGADPVVGTTAAAAPTTTAARAASAAARAITTKHDEIPPLDIWWP